MYEIFFAKKSRKQLKRLQKSGVFDREILDLVIVSLSKGEKLSPRFLDHRLTGDLSAYRECHLPNGILLMYEVHESIKTIVILGIGTHSELFGH